MKIAVFFGSRNPEHDVSIITGQLIISGLKELGHEVIPVYISKDGSWYVGEELGNLDFFKKENYRLELKNYEGFNLQLNTNGKMIFKKQSMFNSTELVADFAFPAIHGQNGEDGTIQGMFEMLNVPYAGCDVPASANAMDKVTTKLIYQRFNIPTTKFTFFHTNEWLTKKDEIMNEIGKSLTFPLFVKPSRLGSSIGIAKVNSKEDLEFAIEVALHYDDKVLVEEGIEDLKDLTVCLIGNDEPIISKIQESTYTKDFFSYEDKYINEGGAQIGNAQKKMIIPADLDEKTTEEIKQQAKDVYRIFGCSGIARVDFLYDRTFKKYYANEINTLPGTIYQHLWKQSGIELKELLTKLIEYGKEKHDKKQKLTYTFESEILKKSNSNKLKLKGNN
ncbi:MAG: D-alanine--D-alanine ligase family protein [Candidatus Dojkabacteria bacterium]